MNMLNAFKKGLILLVLSLVATQAFATPQKLLTNIHKMRLFSTEAQTNFYMYSGLDADAKYGKKITDSIASFEESLAETRQLPAAESVADSITNIEKSWAAYKNLIETNYNDMQSQGFPNVRLVHNMGDKNIELLKVLSQSYQDAKISTGIAPTKVVETARTLSVTMEEITAEYAARGTSNLGQVFLGVSDRSLEDMAEAFRTHLVLLKQQVNQVTNKRLLRSIDSKWSFIERSIKNYNSNTVPFLVTSYSERIIADLEHLADTQ